MGRPKKHDIPEQNNIEELVNANYTVYKIQQELKPLAGGPIQYRFIKDYIKNNYNKAWDEEKQQWVSCNEERFISNVPSTVDYDLNNISKLSNEVNDNTNNILKLSNKIKDVLNALLTKTVQLEKDMRLIKDQLKELSSDKSSQDTCLPEKMINIWNSGKSKKSISVNTELVNEVQNLFSEIYGINDNDSKVIDTALLLALLKHSK